MADQSFDEVDEVDDVDGVGHHDDVDHLDPASPNNDLEQLVGEWLTVPDLSDLLGMRLSDIRQLLEDRQLVGFRIGPRNVMAVPSKFVNESGPLPELPGTFTVLADGRMDDAEILRWLFTPDDTLPVPGAPIDALRAGFKTEIRRRAMEAAM